MIRCEHRSEPPQFDERVRTPGKKWLAENPGTNRRLPSYWLNVDVEVAEAFEHRCAYTAMWLSHPGDIDHFVSIDEDRSKAYEWDNYRYASGWVNRSKRHLRSHEILDPREIGDDWFEIELPSLQLRVTERCPEALRARASFMIERLHLRNGTHVMRSRRAFYAQYERRKNSDPTILDWLDEVTPLIARAIRKQQASASPAT